MHFLNTYDKLVTNIWIHLIFLRTSPNMWDRVIFLHTKVGDALGLIRKRPQATHEVKKRGPSAALRRHCRWIKDSEEMQGREKFKRIAKKTTNLIEFNESSRISCFLFKFLWRPCHRWPCNLVPFVYCWGLGWGDFDAKNMIQWWLRHVGSCRIIPSFVTGKLCLVTIPAVYGVYGTAVHGNPKPVTLTTAQCSTGRSRLGLGLITLPDATQ